MDRVLKNKFRHHLDEFSGLVRTTFFTAVPFLTISGTVLYLREQYALSDGRSSFLLLASLAATLITNFPANWRAALVARRSRAVALFVLPFLVPLAITLLRSDPFVLARTSSTQFMLQGVAVGFILRRLLGKALSVEIFGRPKNRQRMYVALGIGVFLLLMPFSKVHKELEAIYLAGVALGVLVHDRFRTHEAGLAAYNRLKRNVRAIVAGSAGQTPDVSEDFISGEHYLAARDFTALKTLIDQYEQPSTWLIVLKVCMLRMQGEYPQAVAIAEAELQKAGRVEFLDQALHLLLSLSYSEIGVREKVALHLQRALELDRDCPVAKVTLALRLTEDPELARSFPDQQPLVLVREAIAFIEAEETRPNALKRAVARSVPLGHTFLIDAYGRCLLSAGQFELSRTLLTLCIYEDPMYSAAYLHLGEWMLAAEQSLGMSRYASDADLFFRETAHFLLMIAYKMERGRDSLIARRAKRLLGSQGTR